MREFLNRFAMPIIAVIFAAASWVNLREVRLLRSDRSLRAPQFAARQLPDLMNHSYQVVGNKEKIRLSEGRAPILAVYFVKATDCIGVIPEVEELKARFGNNLDVAVVAYGFNDDERGQLSRLFDSQQRVLDCGNCKGFADTQLPSPYRLLVDRSPMRLLIEERPQFTPEERAAVAIKIERLLAQRGYRIPTA